MNKQSKWAKPGISAMGKMIRDKAPCVGTAKDIALYALEKIRKLKPRLP